MSAIFSDDSHPDPACTKELAEQARRKRVEEHRRAVSRTDRRIAQYGEHSPQANDAALIEAFAWLALHPGDLENDDD